MTVTWWTQQRRDTMRTARAVESGRSGMTRQDDPVVDSGSGAAMPITTTREDAAGDTMRIIPVMIDTRIPVL